MLLQVHLADDLVVAGPTEGLPIIVARQLVVLARSVLVARAVWGVPSPFTSRYHRRIKRPLGSLISSLFFSPSRARDGGKASYTPALATPKTNRRGPR